MDFNFEQFQQPQKPPQKPKQEGKFDRGTDLTLFKTDRSEDWFAIIIAMIIALGIYFFIDK